MRFGVGLLLKRDLVCRRARSSALRGLTLPSRGRPTAGFAHCRPPLMSNVRRLQFQHCSSQCSTLTFVTRYLKERRTMRAVALSLAAICCSAIAQTTAPSTFPEEATTPTASELKERLAGRVFNVKLADGGSLRLQYTANGYFFLNTSGGFSDTGEWRTEDGKLCYTARKSKPGCNEMRVKAETIYLKRNSGEVVQYV